MNFYPYLNLIFFFNIKTFYDYKLRDYKFKFWYIVLIKLVDIIIVMLCLTWGSLFSQFLLKFRIMFHVDLCVVYKMYVTKLLINHASHLDALVFWNLLEKALESHSCLGIRMVL